MQDVMQRSRHSGAQPDSAVANPGRLVVSLARSGGDIAEAQRLRFKVFAEEMHARLPNSHSGLDQDDFDVWCDHLIVRDLSSLRVVGTYRILPPHQMRAAGGWYSQTEFDLSRLQHLSASTIEVGRACVHRDYRCGSTILLLWAGLARYMKNSGYRHLIGCASVPLNDGGHLAARLHDELQNHLVAPEYRVFPLLPFPHSCLSRATHYEMPSLIKAYLRLGARVCGDPAWDPDFNSADFPLWLSLDNLHPRYARHFDLLAQQAEATALS
jgi:putative hemolysin